MPIKPSDSIKYLGVKFDNKLYFDQNFISLEQTTTYHLYNLYKLLHEQNHFHFTYTFANTISTKLLQYFTHWTD